MQLLSSRSKDSRQGPPHLLPCLTSCMGTLVTRHLDWFLTLEQQGLNCLLLCQFLRDNHHCCSHRKPNPISLGPDLEATLPTSSSSNNKTNRQAHSLHLDKLKTSLEHPLSPLHHHQLHLRHRVKRQMHKQDTPLTFLRLLLFILALLFRKLLLLSKRRQHHHLLLQLVALKEPIFLYLVFLKIWVIRSWQICSLLMALLFIQKLAWKRIQGEIELTVLFLWIHRSLLKQQFSK
jgi:hypothetical protein